MMLIGPILRSRRVRGGGKAEAGAGFRGCLKIAFFPDSVGFRRNLPLLRVLLAWTGFKITPEARARIEVPRNDAAAPGQMECS